MVRHSFDPYHRECESDSLDWNRREEFMEDNPVSVFALEPHQIDNLVNDRVSVWMLTRPTNVGFLYANRV
jgi:hypothetical protein